ncbi:MAG: transporter substrate-binding domain-containing protein [Deltaproteobacteria bacterium]|nr:transporter substrate-binding domain-containing protein [Deltaproteobacteria bacterium]
MPDNRIHFLSIIMVLLFLPVLAYGAAREEALPRNEKIIVVGGNRYYPPYEFLDREGNPTGYNIDLTKAIADIMGMKVEFRLGVWREVRRALETGDVDILQGMSYSEGRAKVVDFIPHTVVDHSIFARQGVPGVSSLEDLEGKEVAFHGRGFIHDYLNEKKVNLKAVLTDTQADALQLIASGKHDYAVVANFPAAYIIKELRLMNVVPVAKSVISVKYGYAVKKGNTELLARFDEGLAILKQTGQYQLIYDKWLGVFESQGVPWRGIIKYGSIVTILFLFMLSGTLVWSRTLKKQVAIRTADLEREIQERKRAAEELRLQHQQLVQADKMASIGILVSGVAHEINNPNGLILLNTPLIIDCFKDIEPIVEAYYKENGDFEVAGLPYSRMRIKLQPKLLEIQDGAKKIKRIVDDLKDFARRDESEHTHLLNFNAAVKTAVRLVENTIRKSTSRFSRQYAQDMPKIKGHTQRIEQVIVNLILNACQALRNSEEGIFLSTRHDRDRGEVVLEIRDEGEGIAPENLPHLTDPFFTTKRDRGGTGLGLSISAGIIKEHRGSLEFASTPTQGTTITIRIPAVPEEEKS